MITVFSYREGGKCRIYVEGHAEYCPGNDIVCAGVSALIGALAHYATSSPDCHRVRCQMRSGDAFLAYNSEAGSGFDMIVGGLAAIAAAYPAHVRVHSTVTG